MTKRFALAAVLTALLTAPGAAQQTAILPLDMPPPSSYRTASGAPGEAYWQQRADYRIEASLDPLTHRIEGTVTITYTNNSPHALTYLWLQLDQNLFVPNSLGDQRYGAGSRWRGAFEGGGIDIANAAVSMGETLVGAAPIVDGTRMRIDLPAPLAAGGGVAELAMDFSFVIPEHGADRMGRLDVEQGPIYQIAQWYPRMAVYDDVEGWNTLPYLGQGEFYLEYGDFDVSLTVPSDFVVVATGSLLNPEDVYTPDQAERIEQARTSETTVSIVDVSDAGAPDRRPQGEPMLTWRFRAENVRDFAWAASPAFLLDAAGWNGVLLMSAYPKEALGSNDAPGWERATDYLRQAIKLHSDRWHAYPYPTAINVAGRVRGMEYPMLIFCAMDDRGQDLFGVTDHEIGHTWFPMLVGSDERRHAWMDEGLTTFINYYANRSMYGDDADRLAAFSPDSIASRMAGPGGALPSTTPPDRMPPEARGFLSYRKPAFALVLLREYVLGPERFDPAFRDYILRWAYRHPQPADFFRTMEDGTGEDLSWFWRGWFYGSGVFDPSVEPAEQNAFIIRQPNGVLMPLDIRIVFQDGSDQRLRLPAQGFAGQDQVHLVPRQPDVAAIVIDPDHRLPDADRANNRWPR
ncbi:MAG: M1 family metallopeptidase [Rhodothermales bacterium]